MSSVDQKATSANASPRPPSAGAQFVLLLKKELSIEFRTREMISSMGLYALLVLVVFGVAIGQTLWAYDIMPVAGGLLWVLVVFTSLLGLNRSFNREKELSAFEALLVAPLDRGAIFLAKAAANALFLVVIQLIAVPLFAVFFFANTAIAPTAPLVAVPLLVGSVGIAGVGTLLATMTMHTRGRDVMLALLFIPIVFPLLYSCVSAASMTLLGADDLMPFVQATVLALGYDAVMIILGWVLYDVVCGS
ncbi:MAG: heme exporter protein CcmB [Coriobacteriales bacterium]|jgi:heme exporter protein B|nr:heme exporter protein CcmB [Coriobacteriales bacterium]